MWMIANDELYHYGVPGMKRGIRRTRSGMPSNVPASQRFTKYGIVGTQETRRPTLTRNASNAAIRTTRGALPSEVSAAVIKKKLRSNSRYKASRAGMPSYVRR